MNAKRIVWKSASKADIEEFDCGMPKEGQVLVGVEYSVISQGTELAWFQGKENTIAKFPQYPGYSAAGHVLAVGTGVKDFKEGDRVVAYHLNHTSCGIVHESQLTKIHDPDIPAEEAAFTIIAAMTLQGIRKANIELGESVMVMGQGLLGLFGTQLARFQGGLPVIASDISASRLELAKKLGADYALSPKDENLEEKLKEITRGKGVDAIIEVTGRSEALNQALKHAAWRGRIILLGCARSVTDGINFYTDVHKPGLSIIGAHNFVRPKQESSHGHWTMRDDVTCLLSMISQKRLNVRLMISEYLNPENAEAVYAKLLEGKNDAPGLVFKWKKD